MTISPKNCMMPVHADVCKRTCGLCNDKQLPLPSVQLPLGLPPLPLPLNGKQLHTWFHCKIFDSNDNENIFYN